MAGSVYSPRERRSKCRANVRTQLSLFFQFGRALGYKAIPVIRNAKVAWKSLTGSDAESIEAEAEFGRALAAELRLKAGVSRDPQTVSLVAGITRTLTPCIRNKARSFKVEVLLEPDVAALSLPGGFIFVNQGLIEFCERSPDELAFVIGHEMGHVIRGHAMERVLLRIGSEGLSSILSRGLLTPMLRDAGLKWLQASYAVPPELEADEFAIRIAAAAGLRPDGALSFLQRTAALREAGNPTGDYISSHPPEAVRVENIKAVLGQSRSE